MKKLIKYSLVLLFVLMSINVYAKCETSELERLKVLAEKVEFTYDYKIGNDINFSITATNLNSELKVLIIEDYYMDDYQEFKYNKNKTYTLNNFKNNEKVLVTIKGYVKNECSGETVLTKYVNLPYYNNFASSQECKLYPDFKYCATLLENSINKETFDSELEKYLNSNLQEEEPPKVKEDGIFLYVVVGILFIVVLIIIIIMVVKKKRKEYEL